MKTEMRMQTVQRAKRFYIADDGREFTEFDECLDWEVNMYLRQLKDSKDVIECKELLDYYPFNYIQGPAEHTSFRWFKPLNKRGIELLNKTFPSADTSLTYSDIGKWVCVAYEPPKHNYCWYTLAESIRYANKVLALINNAEQMYEADN